MFLDNWKIKLSLQDSKKTDYFGACKVFLHVNKINKQYFLALRYSNKYLQNVKNMNR